ncbi:hypothetical protein NUM3379_09540 [Kineococcus sp. NUM-3379]
MALNIEFAARAFDEGSPGDWCHQGWSFEVDPVALGRVAEREGVWCEWEPEEPGDLMGQLIRAQHGTVVRALVDVLGENLLFASLWASRSSRTRYPLSDERYFDAVNGEDMGGKSDAYMWLSDGMEL